MGREWLGLGGLLCGLGELHKPQGDGLLLIGPGETDKAANFEPMHMEHISHQIVHAE